MFHQSLFVLSLLSATLLNVSHARIGANTVSNKQPGSSLTPASFGEADEERHLLGIVDDLPIPAGDDIDPRGVLFKIDYVCDEPLTNLVVVFFDGKRWAVMRPKDVEPDSSVDFGFAHYHKVYLFGKTARHIWNGKSDLCFQKEDGECFKTISVARQSHGKLGPFTYAMSCPTDENSAVDEADEADRA
mmetsp:Transcript_1304/g.1903  ORF Transcript_1304/g.1903 Transcript_1304/m.1903 type:complete len:188 (+) Transcript_1304:69-632(+)